jgi:hypothetical protein
MWQSVIPITVLAAGTLATLSWLGFLGWIALHIVWTLV